MLSSIYLLLIFFFGQHICCWFDSSSIVNFRHTVDDPRAQKSHLGNLWYVCELDWNSKRPATAIRILELTISLCLNCIAVWCRRTDELVDGPNSSHITPTALDRWEQRLTDVFEGRPYDMFDAALSHTVSKYPVDIQVPYIPKWKSESYVNIRLQKYV